MKKPLVLVPGLLCTRRLYEAQIATLEDDFDIIVADVSIDDSLAAMAERILDDAPDNFYLAGLSMGGYVALEVTVKSPERIGKLALLDTNARADTEEQTRLRLALIENGKKTGLEAVARELVPRLVHESRVDDREIIDTVIEMAEATGIEVFERQERGIIARADLRPLLKEIPCPTLVVCGREDVITPLEMSEEMANGIPNAELHVVERCGHLSTMERPDEVSGTLRRFFL